MTEFCVDFSDPATDRAVVIEDDGRAGYAYLLDGGVIVSHVWLYNRGSLIIWDDFGQVPWPNHSALISPERTEPLTDDRAIRCAWDARGVDVVIDGTRWARLEHGACPGWSRLAVVDGPLARRLELACGLVEGIATDRMT